MPSIESHSHAVPGAILLATDLSARSDRALARAIQLARQWNARLVVATVVAESDGGDFAAGGDSDQARMAARRLHRLLDEDASGIPLETRVAHGHVGRALLRLAAEEDCGLIITGVASDPLFELPLLGSTVLWLTRHSPLPVLVVHDRVRGPYRHLTLASDFSDSAQYAARHALALLGHPLELSLVHALDATGSVLLTGDRAELEAQALATARDQANARLADMRGLLGPARVEVRITPGAPSSVLQQHAEHSGTELVVVATHGRGALFELLIGSVARRLVAVLETDTLLVRDPRSLAAATAIAGLAG